MRRRLKINEIDEAELVFTDNLHYDRIWIYEDEKLPLWVARIGAFIAREDPPGKNAITLRKRIYFSDLIKTSPVDIQDLHLDDMKWLIHELTHAWQYQHLGIRYLYDAIKVQIKLGSEAYKYGKERGLEDAHAVGKTFLEFNPEQQGDIASDYYGRLKTGQDVSAWDPYINELKTLPM